MHRIEEFHKYLLRLGLRSAIAPYFSQFYEALILCFFSYQEERSSPGGNEPTHAIPNIPVIAEGCHHYILFFFKNSLLWMTITKRTLPPVPNVR
jgi:hypothetical protein